MHPYPDQIKWMNDIREVLVADGRPLAQSPTGFGKSFCYSLMAKAIAKEGKTITIAVHRRELIWQCVLTLAKIKMPAGVLAPASVQFLIMKRAALSGFFLNQNSPIQILSIDTANARIKKGRMISTTDYLLIDEGHHSAAPTWKNVINHYIENGARLVGATATPERASGEGLSIESGGFFTELVMGPPLEELVKEGRIAEPVIYYPKKHFEKTHIRMSDGEYVAEDIEKESRTLTGSILRHYRKHFNGQPALVFCANLHHCEYMKKRYQEAGWKAEVVDGRMKEHLRADRIAAIGDGRLNVLISCDLISEGLDVPSVAGAQLLRPTTSRTLLYQQIGRALRIAPGKTKGIILDHAGNFLEHEHPYEMREAEDWNFHGQEKEKREPSTPSHVICSGCRAIYSSRLRKCPQCQKEREIKKEILKETDEELERLDWEERYKQWSAETGWVRE